MPTDLIVRGQSDKPSYRKVAIQCISRIIDLGSTRMDRVGLKTGYAKTNVNGMVVFNLVFLKDRDI